MFKFFLVKNARGPLLPFWFPGALGFRIILGFRLISFGFGTIHGCRIIGFGFRIIRFWLQNHPRFQNHSSTNAYGTKNQLSSVWDVRKLIFEKTVAGSHLQPLAAIRIAASDRK